LLTFYLYFFNLELEDRKYREVNDNYTYTIEFLNNYSNYLLFLILMMKKQASIITTLSRIK